MPFASPSRAPSLVAGLIAFVALTCALVAMLDEPTQTAILREGGPVETLSVLGYLLAAALVIASIAISRRTRSWPLAGILLVMAAREVDLDKRPFTLGLLKSRQYIGGDVPLAEQVISAVILLGIVALLVLALRRFGGDFLRGLRGGAAWAWLVATGMGLVIVTKSIDGIGRKLAPFGVDVAEPTLRTAAMIEEIGELAIAIAFVLAAVDRAGPALLRRSAQTSDSRNFGPPRRHQSKT